MMSLKRRVDEIYRRLIAEPTENSDAATRHAARVEWHTRAMAAADGLDDTGPWSPDERLQQLNRIRAETYELPALATLPAWPEPPAWLAEELAKLSAEASGPA